MAKTLIFAFDAAANPDTLQDIPAGNNTTNILKLHILLGGYGSTATKKDTSAGVTQHSFYYEGIGRYGNVLYRLIDRLSGISYDKVIAAAEKDLRNNYQEGDEVVLLGYGHGAATARMFAARISDVPVRFLGIFDTVATTGKDLISPVLCGTVTGLVLAWFFAMLFGAVTGIVLGATLGAFLGSVISVWEVKKIGDALKKCVGWVKAFTTGTIMKIAARTKFRDKVDAEKEADGNGAETGKENADKGRGGDSNEAKVVAAEEDAVRTNTKETMRVGWSMFQQEAKRQLNPLHGQILTCLLLWAGISAGVFLGGIFATASQQLFAPYLGYGVIRILGDFFLSLLGFILAIVAGWFLGVRSVAVVNIESQKIQWSTLVLFALLLLPLAYVLGSLLSGVLVTSFLAIAYASLVSLIFQFYFQRHDVMGEETEQTGLRPQHKLLFEQFTISANVEHTTHLVSLDEMRTAFVPALCDYEPGRVEEVWFPGIHGDIGGGYWHDGLADNALCFMQERLQNKLGKKIHLYAPNEVNYTAVSAAMDKKQKISHGDDSQGNVTVEKETTVARQWKWNITEDDIELKALYLGPIHSNVLSLSHKLLIPYSLCLRVLHVKTAEKAVSEHLPVLHESVQKRFQEMVEYRPAPLHGACYKLLKKDSNGKEYLSGELHGLSGLRINRVS